MLVLSTHALQAQQPAVDVYRARVVTTRGYSVRGTLEDVDSFSVYVGGHYVPLSMIRKVVIRRQNNKRTYLLGAVLGAIAVGYITNQSLQKNPTSSAAAHGLTVGLGAVGGGAAGLLVGSALGTLNAKVVRSNKSANADISLYRELRPFSVRYQQRLLNRLPTGPRSPSGSDQ